MKIMSKMMIHRRLEREVIFPSSDIVHSKVGDVLIRPLYKVRLTSVGKQQKSSRSTEV